MATIFRCLLLAFLLMCVEGADGLSETVDSPAENRLRSCQPQGISADDRGTYREFEPDCVGAPMDCLIG